MHLSLDTRTAVPKGFIGFYPATVPQTELDEAVNLITSDGKTSKFVVGPPKKTESLAARETYEPTNPADLQSFGPTENRPLGDIALGRSGDKGANVNIGLFVQTAEQYQWFRSFMTSKKMQELMGKDWQDWYFIERVEFKDIFAVHFVVYGALQKGVTSSALLDSLGKGFAEFIRAVHIPVPSKFLKQDARL